MTTAVSISEGISLDTTANDENVAKNESTSSAMNPDPKLNPTKEQSNLTVDTGAEQPKPELSTESLDDNSNTSSLVFSTGSIDQFSIDRYASLDKGADSMNDADGEPIVSEDPNNMVSETPKALNQMMEKFEMLQASSIATPKVEDLEKVDDNDIYRDNRLFEIMSPHSQERVEVRKSEGDDQAFASYSNSYSSASNDMFDDIEQFRSGDSHMSDPENMVTNATTAASNLDSNKQKMLEKRIISLMNKVSQIELENNELQTKNTELQSQLNTQHEQDVQDMYQNPYNDPFGTPTKSASGDNMPSFLQTATSNFQPGVMGAASMGAMSTSTIDNGDLHRELTELRMKNQSLQNDLETSDRVKERLKKILKTVQAEDKQKLDMINSMTQELDESKEREAALKKELDTCKIRLEGFEIAQNTPREAMSEAASNPSSPERKKFFGKDKATAPSDVATALVVSKRQNEALEAFNKELEQQNSSLLKKCDGLQEKYGLKAPSQDDDKGNQLYHRYLEAKSEVSTLSIKLEEAQENSSNLNERVAELETELSEKKESGGDNDVAAIDSLKSIFNNSDSSTPSDGQNAITAQQEEALKGLVGKLEIQMQNYREAEERHAEVRAELEQEAFELREQLEEAQSQNPSPQNPAFTTTSELENCYSELETKMSTDNKSELEALKNAMDTAAEESTKLLNELEAKLAMVREELRFERTRYKDLNMKFKALKMLVEREGGDMGALLLEENESLRTSVISLQKETKQLQSELEKKTIKIEKSEKRVTAKHEQARQLNEANASLRDGIQKLKDHLSTISEQASKTEATLATTKDEVDKEREKAMKLEVANETLQTKVAVFRESIGGSSDQATSKTIELTASLAAINKELSLERERARKLMDAKRELQVTFDTTRENLQTQLHTHTTKNSEFETQILSLEEELQGTKNLAAASNKKLEELNESKSKEFAKLQGVLESTRELLTAEKSKAEGMKTLKTTMESKLDTMKQRVEVLQSSNDCLKEELEAMKRKASTNASESSHQFTELEKLLATTQEELNEEEQQVESLEKQVDDLTMQIQELEKCKSDLEASLDDVKQEMETVNAKNAELLVKLKSAGEDNDSDEIPSVPSKNAASQDVRLWEAEMLLGNTKRELKDALKQNEELTGKVNNLESSLEKSQETNAQTLAESETHVQVNKEMAELIDSLQTQLKSLNEENQSLMKRTAALARRDQIQKASLTTSNGEIETLMTTMSDFQKRFETLAAQVEQVESEKNAQMKDFEEQEAKWIAERTGLNDLIAKLQKKCEEMKAKYEAVDAKHVRALMKEQSAWQTERVALNSRIAHFEKSDSFTKPDSAVSYPPLQTCNTDRSMLNQKVSELEQDMQLLEVTMEDKKQQHLVATAELEVAKYKLKEAEEELQSCRSEIQLLVLRSVTDREDFNGQVRELQEDLESMKDAVEAAKKERNANEANYESCLEELNLCKDDLKSLKTATDAELKSAIEQYEELESKYDTCVKELASCQAEMKEKEEVMRELAKKQVEQRDDQEKHARSSKALELLTDELNDAHIREKELEDVLSSCKKELTSCKKKLKSIQVDDAPDDERGGDSYKDVIANLNRSNNSLIVTNQKLKDEIESLRVVAEGNNVNTSNASSLTAGTSDEVERENLMMKDLLATSQNSVSESKNIQKRLLKQIEAASKRETKLSKEILALKARNEENEKRLEEQEQELDEFESDFALARSDARKVVDKLRKQLSQLEKRNKLLESSSGGQDAIDDLRNKLKALVQRNKRLEKEISVCKTREQRLQSQLDLESRRCR